MASLLKNEHIYKVLANNLWWIDSHLKFSEIQNTCKKAKITMKT